MKIKRFLESNKKELNQLDFMDFFIRIEDEGHTITIKDNIHNLLYITNHKFFSYRKLSDKKTMSDSIKVEIKLTESKNHFKELVNTLNHLETILDILSNYSYTLKTLEVDSNSFGKKEYEVNEIMLILNRI